MIKEVSSSLSLSELISKSSSLSILWHQGWIFSCQLRLLVAATSSLLCLCLSTVWLPSGTSTFHFYFDERHQWHTFIISSSLNIKQTAIIYLQAWLRSSGADSDFELQLFQYSSSKGWVAVASSTSSGSSESIVYQGAAGNVLLLNQIQKDVVSVLTFFLIDTPPVMIWSCRQLGYYIYGIYSAKGSGEYTLYVEQPTASNFNAGSASSLISFSLFSMLSHLLHALIINLFWTWMIIITSKDLVDEDPPPSLSSMSVVKNFVCVGFTPQPIVLSLSFPSLCVIGGGGQSDKSSY